MQSTHTAAGHDTKALVLAAAVTLLVVVGWVSGLLMML